MKPLDEFEVRVYIGRGTTERKKTCIPCLQKEAARYQKIAKETIEYQKRPEKRQRERELAQTDARKATSQAARTKWLASDSGVAAVARGREVRKEKVRNNPGLRLQASVCASLRERLGGKRVDEDSVNIVRYTEFSSVSEMLAHFETQLKPGMEMSNYGVVWSIGHRIPQAYYDFSSKDEIMRCNSKSNLTCDYDVKNNPMGEKTNKQKSASIPNDEELHSIGIEHWPAAFGSYMSSEKRFELNAALWGR